MAEVKRYEGCDKLLEMYPEWKRCGRPVKVQKNRPVRCEKHPIRDIWGEL